MKKNTYGKAVDWWEVGVIMYRMMCGKLPFYSKDLKTLFELIIKVGQRKGDVLFRGCHTSVGRDQVPSQPVTCSRISTRETAGERSQETVGFRERGRGRWQLILSHRLGGGVSDAEEVKSHKFFQTINWDVLYHKRIPPPLVPHITSPTTTVYFEKEFTDQNLQLTPPPSETKFPSLPLPPPLISFNFSFSSGPLKDYGDIFKDF